MTTVAVENMGLYRKELLKGSTETLILSLLADQAMYGYQLVKEMEQRSDGYFRLKEGTLYPALHRLERDGLVEGYWEQSASGQSRRYYDINSAGTDKLRAMLTEWKMFTTAVNQIARPPNPRTDGS